MLDATKRAGADPTEVIAEYALANLFCAAGALDLFIAADGSFAGNIALTALARRRRASPAGGIAPRIINRLKEGGFVRHFLIAKGAFMPLLSGIPVRAVRTVQVGLRGALGVAAEV